MSGWKYFTQLVNGNYHRTIYKYTVQDYRKPPKPQFYYTAGKGMCRWCGLVIFKKTGDINTRANWHPDCVKAYRVIHFPRDTKRAVWNRDKGICYLCGSRVGHKEWELEHIRPLYEALGRIEYWELPNLGTACRPCHKIKTRGEASARALVRKNRGLT